MADLFEQVVQTDGGRLQPIEINGNPCISVLLEEANWALGELNAFP